MEEKIELAKLIIGLNNDMFALSGSLMCYVRGIKTRREPTDIDMVGQYGDLSDIIVTKDFEFLECKGRGSEINCIMYIHKPTGIKIDFIYSEEEFESINDILCGNLQSMITSKLIYSRTDKLLESRDKHNLDLELLVEHMSTFNNDLYTKHKDSKPLSTPIDL